MKLLQALKRLTFNKLLFLLIVFFLPQQFGPHFWPTFAFVDGIRIDYLSPTFYISDFLILILSLFSIKTVICSTQTRRLVTNKFFFIFLLSLLFPLFYASSVPALLSGLIKLLELLFLGLYILKEIKEKDLRLIFIVFAASSLIESLLACLQFFAQSSINGTFYFLGERYFTAGSVGQAVLNTNLGLFVRPYATFPHPNVLAFYLFISSVVSTYLSHISKKSLKRLLFLALFITSELSLFLTFSRIVIGLNILFIFYAYVFLPLRDSEKNKKLWVGSVLLFLFMLILYATYFSQRYFSLAGFLNGVIPRVDLTLISISIIEKYPFFGVGLHNFYFHESSFQNDLSGTYLQPVHNIFLLITSETGLVGLTVFVYFTIYILRGLFKDLKQNMLAFNIRAVLFILFLSFIIQGMFDHFFLTTQQGQLITVFLLTFPLLHLSKTSKSTKLTL